MTEVRRGRLIALEGIDGCGKSTQARMLAEHLAAELTHEPGATPLGRDLRTLLLDPAHPALSPRTEALLMAADRAQHVEEVVWPVLAEGRWVITDRYSGSTLAYQGWGRGLDIGPLRSLVAWASGGLDPDLSILVDVAPDVARCRRDGAPDRLEGLDAGFHERVREGYLALAAADGEHWAVVDGSGTVTEVAALVAQAVEDRLGSPSRR